MTIKHDNKKSKLFHDNFRHLVIEPTYFNSRNKLTPTTSWWNYFTFVANFSLLLSIVQNERSQNFEDVKRN